jgi:hypothetical protein
MNCLLKMPLTDQAARYWDVVIDIALEGDSERLEATLYRGGVFE